MNSFGYEWYARTYYFSGAILQQHIFTNEREFLI